MTSTKKYRIRLTTGEQKELKTLVTGPKLTLIPSLKPVLRKFQRFSTSERYRMLG